jgi:hypothetical protein
MAEPLPDRQPDDEFDPGCECELDWSCPLHAGRPPWIDRRFQGQDDDEARAFGRHQDLPMGGPSLDDDRDYWVDNQDERNG